MLQNIRILAGDPPTLTGVPEADREAVEHYLRRLSDGLEYSLEELDRRLEKVEGGGSSE